MVHPSFFGPRIRFLAMVTLLLPVAGARLRAATAVLEKAPAQSLVCVKINNLNDTLMRTDQFLAGVSPVGVSLFARMGLGQVLGSPMLTGVDMNGDLALFVAAMTPQRANAGPMPPISAGLLVPVTDYEQFIAGNSNCGTADADGVSQLTAPGVPPMFIGSSGRFALLGPAKDKQDFLQLQQEIAAQTQSILTSLPEVLKDDAGAKPLWAYCNMELVNKTFGPLIQMQLQMAKAMATGMQGQAPGIGMDPGAMIENSAQLLTMFLEQSQYLTLSLEPSATALHLSKAFGARPDTDLAALLQGNGQTQRNPLLGHLANGALANVSFRGNGQILAKVDRWIADQPTGMPKDEGLSGLRACFSDMAKLLGQGGVCSIATVRGEKPPIQVRYLFDAKVSGQFLPLLRKSITSANASLAGFDEEMGLKARLAHKAQGQTYQGVPIDETRLSFEDVDTDSPQAQAIRQIYGEGMQLRWAVVGNICLGAFGGDADRSIRGMIDATKAAKKDVESETQAALGLLPGAELADLFVTLNVLRLFDLVAAQAPDRLPQVDLPPSKSNLVLAGRIDGGKARADLVLPKDHLVEIRDLVQNVMMARMATGTAP